MLDYLGEKEAANSITTSIEKTLSDKKSRTKDLDGESNFTAELEKLNEIPSKFQKEITPEDSISQIQDFNFFNENDFNDNLIG